MLQFGCRRGLSRTNIAVSYGKNDKLNVTATKRRQLDIRSSGFTPTFASGKLLWYKFLKVATDFGWRNIKVTLRRAHKPKALKAVCMSQHSRAILEDFKSIPRLKQTWDPPSLVYIGGWHQLLQREVQKLSVAGR